MTAGARFPLADGHADSLMWNRDLTARLRKGQLDFPRLAEAGVRIQCFTVVTRGYPVVDGMRAFGALRGWPAAARRGPWARALFQLDRMHALCDRVEGAVRIAGTSAELEDNLAYGRISAVLGVEGAQALEGRPERVSELRARGVRFMSLTHLSNNELGGSSSPLMGDRPLTPLGREVVDAMAAARLSVDVAHASHRTFRDLAAQRAARLFCSHTGVTGATRSWRNLEDAELRVLAERGGVVGILFATIYRAGLRLRWDRAAPAGPARCDGRVEGRGRAGAASAGGRGGEGRVGQLAAVLPGDAGRLIRTSRRPSASDRTQSSGSVCQRSWHCTGE